MKKIFNQSTFAGNSVKTIVNLTILAFLVASTSCSNDTLLSSTEPTEQVWTGSTYETNTDAQFLLEMEKLQTSGRGNFGNPDFENEGEMYFVSKEGVVSKKLTLAKAAEYVRQCKWIDVNGSGTSLDAAKDSTILRANALGTSMVLVYIAQGMNYWDAEDETFKTAFSNLINKVGNTPIYAMSHSWSGHIVTHLLRDKPNVTHFAINPAHGNFKEGEKVADYVNDLLHTKSPTYIMSGTADPVARLGGGTAWKEWWGIAGYDSVYRTPRFHCDQGNWNVSICTVKGSDHMIESMIKKGGFKQILQIINK